MTASILRSPLTMPIRYRDILLRSTVDEIRKQFAGSALGVIWIVLGPLILVSLYSAVYLIVFRVQPVDLSPHEYVLYVTSGLLPFIAFAGALVSGANCIRSDRDLLLNKVFPAELLPLRATLVATAPLLVGITLISTASVVLIGGSWWLLLIPFAIINQVLFTAGLTSMLALLTIIIRDVQHSLQYIVLILLIITPIGYTHDMVPGSIRLLLYINPLYYFTTIYQYGIVYQTVPPGQILAGALVLGIGVYGLGFMLFQYGKQVIDDYA